MKHLKYLILILVLALTGCGAGSSPFLSNDPSLQVAGATEASDSDREIGVYFTVKKAVKAGVKKEYITGFADALESVSKAEITGGDFKQTLNKYVDDNAKTQDDKIFAKWFIGKLSIPKTEISNPLSPEKKRVLGFYAKVIKDTVKNLQ